jgi:hypothetical protein
MAALAAVRHIRASFREERSFSILTGDLVSQGTMVYRAPDEVVFLVDTPNTVTYRFSPNWFEISEPEKPDEAVPLAPNPPLQVFVHTVLATFAGDLAALQHHYRVHYESAPGSWLLRLAPRDPLIAGQLDSVLIHGRGNYAEIVERREAGGDRIVTRFAPSLIE